MMGKNYPTLVTVLAVVVFVFTFGAGPVHAEGKTTRTLAMPACPIQATTVPPTKTVFELPDKNPLGETFSVVGTVQVTDQTGSTVSLTQYGAAADLTSITFARTVKTLQHETGSLSFDRGCTSTDPYGSNHCSWTWGESITVSDQGALQEDITSGKLIVNLLVDNTAKVQFTCPVCGASCTITVPEQVDHPQGRWDKTWDLITQLFRFPLFLATPLPDPLK